MLNVLEEREIEVPTRMNFHGSLIETISTNIDLSAFRQFGNNAETCATLFVLNKLDN